MTVEWTNDDVDAKAVTLLLLQNGRAFAEAESIFRNFTVYNQKNQWEWVVATSHALTSNAFTLGLYYEGQTGAAAGCRWFNITNPRGLSEPQPSSSIALQSSSAGPASSTSPAGSTPTTTTPPSPTAPSDSGLRDEQKIGLGVGIGVGIPFVALIGFCCFLLWRLLKRQRKKEQHQDQAAAAVSGRESGLYFAGNEQNRRDGRTENHENYRPYQVGPEELP